MSLFGSLITGVSALSAQAQSISMIANNIANVNTVGYKRREAAFQSLVTSESRNARYTPGSVLARAVQKIDSQGALQQTNSTTDVAISGNGFFVVQRSPEGLQEKLFTRAGSFSEDSNGYLRNTAGFYLMGWRIDENGNLPAGRDDISSLESVNVSLLGGLTKATSSAEFSLNLDASETPTAYPVASSTAPDFKRTLRVFDSLGEGQNLELQFTKHTSPTAYSVSSISGAGAERSDLLTSFAGVDAGESVNIAVGTANNTFTVTSTSTVQDLIDFVNNDPDLQLVASAELTTDGQIKINARNFEDTVAVTDVSTTGAAGTAATLGFSTMSAYNHSTLLGPLTNATTFASLGTITTGDDLTVAVGTDSYTFTVTGTNTIGDFITGLNAAIGTSARAQLTSSGEIQIQSLDSANAVTVTSGTGTAATQLGFTQVAETTPTQPDIFPAAGLANTPNAYGWWELSLVDLDTGTVLKQGSLNFNSDGTLNGAKDVNGLSEISLTDINWGNGSALQTISMDIGGLTQFSGEYNVTSATQNGAELGLRTGVEVDRDGIVTARFSNGQTSALFKLPLATFTAVNGLSEQSGNAFIQSAESGSYNLREAGNGGAGLVEGSAVETSNVDIADEFTKMIVTQRSYSAGTKVIQTADQMTEELLRLR
ncbi:MAG: flagellar hook-basal body complex protein [Rhodospirillales bacterium]|nr:flagellar hook-basal body complex protein [Alphaproteobacteria bacterium]MCB9987125.1 flagellar hook-basal body complex protein [Rhodospirillales bacterium]USO08117.1 MAG: flagellar hook-basal body complex protein [Rhodospirillales bacterium]